MRVKTFLRRNSWLGHTACLMAGFALASSVLAADGDIIIMREVQPRNATRAPLVPDPNPQVINPKPNAVIDRALGGMATPGELSDGDFAAVTGGHGMPQHGLSSPHQLASERHLQPSGGAAALPSSPAAGHSGGALGGVAGQINRGLQQGLRPLQGLNGR